MSETAKKTYAYPATWFNTVDQLRAAFGEAFVAMRNEEIKLGQDIAAIREKQVALVEKTFAEQGKAAPEGLRFKLIRNFKTGAIGLTLDEVKAEKKAKKANETVSDKLASFGSVLVKRDQSMKDAGLASVPLPAELDRRVKRK